MGVTRSIGDFNLMVDVAEQRLAYNSFRKVRVLYEKIVARTPVLSGALRAGWNVSYGAPDYTFKDVEIKTGAVAPLPAPMFNLTYDKKKAWRMFIANGAPYVQRIEDGWSTGQAPSGMVRISILEVFGGPG